MSIEGQGHCFTIYFPGLYVLCFSRPRYQVSVHRTIGPLVKHFYENLPFLPRRQPIKFTDLDKSRMKRRGLLNKRFCKKNPNIPNETEKIVNFLFSHYKSMGNISCHSNQSSYPIGIKTQLFIPPTYRCYM